MQIFNNTSIVVEMGKIVQIKIHLSLTDIILNKAKMLFRILFFLFIMLSTSGANGQQVGINTRTPHASAAFEVYDTARGMLIPRLTKRQRDSIQNPADGLLIYQKDSLTGFWYYSQQSWKQVIEQNNQPINQSIKRLQTQLYIKP